MQRKYQIITVFVLGMLFSGEYYSHGADKVVVIPLKGDRIEVPTGHGQLLYNKDGGLAASTLFYDLSDNKFAFLGFPDSASDAKIDINGITWVRLGNSGDDRIELSTPSGVPGLIARHNNKRMDILFNDGAVTIESSGSSSAPVRGNGLTVTSFGRVGVKTPNPLSTLDVRGEIRSIGPDGTNRLWGKGRPGLVALYNFTEPGCSANGIYFSVSKTIATWNNAESVCPAGTWVCTAAERGSTICDPEGVYERFHGCDGSDYDAKFAGDATSGLWSYLYIDAWVADIDNSTDNSAYLWGRFVNLGGSPGSASVCRYRPVWCCSNGISLL